MPVNRMEYVEKSCADFLDTNFETLRATLAALSPATTMPAVSAWKRGYGRSFGEKVLGFVDCLTENELDYRNNFYTYDIEVTLLVPATGFLDTAELKRAAQRYAQGVAELVLSKTAAIRGVTLGDAAGIHNVRLESSEAPPVISDRGGENQTLGFQVKVNLTAELQTDNVT